MKIDVYSLDTTCVRIDQQLMHIASEEEKNGTRKRWKTQQRTMKKENLFMFSIERVSNEFKARVDDKLHKQEEEKQKQITFNSILT